MRLTYRHHDGNRAYWRERWEQVPADSEDLNLNRYPGRYAEAVLSKNQGRVLEAGCGAGRVWRHYHRAGREIIGFDFIATALAKLSSTEDKAQLGAGTATHLPFAGDSFSVVLAFGLYHNLEQGFEGALAETLRVLEPGGTVCASLRLDNLQNRIVDRLADRRANNRTGGKLFHKANYTPRELSDAFAAAAFRIEKFEYVENMPLLYKFSIFRRADHRRFNEHVARQEGYALSTVGRLFQNLLIKFWPGSFCNIAVITARAPAEPA